MNTKTVAWITGSLTLLLAIFSFILSFNALTDLAAKHNVSIPYLFPLVVEAGVVIFSLNALYRSLSGEHARWQWVLIIGSSLMAGTFNVLHSNPDWVSQTMAAMPSLFLLLSFESFLNQIKHSVKRSKVVKNIEQLVAEFDEQRATLTAELDQLRSAVTDHRSELEHLTQAVADLEITRADLEREIAALEVQKRAATSVQADALTAYNQAQLNAKEQAKLALLDFYRLHPNASLATAGQAVNRSKATISNYLAELEQAGLVHRNGQGVEVME